MVHQGLTTLCPPVTLVPACRAESLKPRIINGMTTSRSFSCIFVLTASSISMLSHSVTPIAYKSLSTFAHVILPIMYGSSTIG
uniref:Putative secreted protein n=1 Tax=Anopheles marajoara TaxID=58244 RepID=A0A2M4CB85_9DIPT